MAYTTTEFLGDLNVVARTLHLAFRRSEYLTERWYAGLNNEIPNDSTEITSGLTGAEIHSLMSRADDLVTDYTANNNAKYNTILQVSDLKLPE